MIIKTVKDLRNEYKRRIKESTAYCEECNINIRRHQHFKVQVCRSVFFVPGTDFQIPPAGWSGATCSCGKHFPEINYEELETDPPCDCTSCNREKNKE